MIALKLAVRNLARNRWRSGLTLGGVAVAVALLVWLLSFYEGWIAEMVRGATSVRTGQLQIQTAAYADQERIYRSFEVDPGMLEAVEAVEGVVAASPRIAAAGIVGNERRSRVAQIMGVDPEREARVSPLTSGVEEGRWLSSEAAPEGSPREVVLGADLAGQLRVEVGAELVVFLEAADGSLGNDLLRVVGTVRTGNSGLDRMAAWLHLDDARRVTALEGEANTVVVRSDDPASARALASSVAAALSRESAWPIRAATGNPAASDEGSGEAAVDAGEILLVRPWQHIIPEMDQMILLTRRSYWIVYLVVYLVAALGILNTQRMSALERRREFGVMLAVGVRPRRMFRILEVETAILGLAGAVLGAVLGGGLAWYHSTVGLDMSALTSEASFTYMGVSFDERIHAMLSARRLAEPLLVMLGVSLVSGLWPAVTAARIEPAPTIAGRRT